MNRTATLVGYAVIAVALAACQVGALVTRRLPTLGQVVSLAVRHRPGRWLLLAGWFWAGWHLFVRSGS